MFLQQLFQHLNHNFSALTTAAIWIASLNKSMTHTNPEWNTNVSMTYLFPQAHTSDYLEFFKTFFVVNAPCGYPTITPHTTTAVVRESWFSRIWPYFQVREMDRGSTKPYGIKVAEPNYISEFPPSSSSTSPLDHVTLLLKLDFDNCCANEPLRK